MKKKHKPQSLKPTLFTLLIACLITSTGCETIQSVLNEATFTKPTASITDVRLLDLGLESTTLAFDVKVSNPYAIALPLLTTDYSLVGGEEKTPFLSGKAEPGGSIPAKGSTVITLPAEIRYDSLLSILSGVKPGSVLDYSASLGLSIETPGDGSIRLPVSHTGQLPIPTVPDVELTSFKWGELSLNKASAVFDLKIGNRNEFPVDLSKLNYDLSLSGISIADASMNQATSFGAGSSENLEIPLSFSPLNLGLAVFNMLKGDGADYNITGEMDFQTPFGPMNLPFNGKGQTDFDH